MKKELLAIFEYLERDKGIKRDLIVKAIEDALITAARKGPKGMPNLNVHINSKTGEISAHSEREIVEVVEYPEEEITLEAARELDPNSQIGDWIDIPIIPESLGRIAAQTARQVIAQKLRMAERDVIHEEYRHRVGDIISGTVVRLQRGGNLMIDLGKVEAFMPGSNYPRTERYHIGDKVLALLHEVQEMENGGAQVVLSRSHPEFVSALFAQEVAEIHDGSVEITKIVRDPGYRTKMAVSSSDMKIDPVGACVGMRGTRVKNVIRELNNEKIDVLPYSPDSFVLLKNAMSCEFKKIDFDEDQNLITIVVDDEDYPAILGKRGSNARLTGQLIGTEILIHKASQYEKDQSLERQKLALDEDSSLDDPITSIEGINQLVVDSMLSAGLDTPRKVLRIPLPELSKQLDISLHMAEDILEEIMKTRKHVG
jgi:transcription termination/antitermination protein NusA